MAARSGDETRGLPAAAMIAPGSGWDDDGGSETLLSFEVRPPFRPKFAAAAATAAANAKAANDAQALLRFPPPAGELPPGLSSTSPSISARSCSKSSRRCSRARSAAAEISSNGSFTSRILGQRNSPPSRLLAQKAAMRRRRHFPASARSSSISPQSCWHSSCTCARSCSNCSPTWTRSCSNPSRHWSRAISSAGGALSRGGRLGEEGLRFFLARAATAVHRSHAAGHQSRYRSRSSCNSRNIHAVGSASRSTGFDPVTFDFAALGRYRWPCEQPASAWWGGAQATGRPARGVDRQHHGTRCLEGHHALGTQRVHLLGRGCQAGDDPRTPHSPDPGGAGGRPAPALLLAGVQAPRPRCEAAAGGFVAFSVARCPSETASPRTGEIVATRLRGAWTGNRGLLHEGREIVRSHAGDLWITCALEFRGRHRELWLPNRWTPLFFHDEAVAFAAGHRPCGECRHGRISGLQSGLGGGCSAARRPRRGR